jgi:hypothetical protein
MEYAETDAAHNSFWPNQVLWIAERLIFNTGLYQDFTKDEILQNLTNQLVNILHKEMEDMKKDNDHLRQQRNAPTSNGTNFKNTAGSELAMS